MFGEDPRSGPFVELQMISWIASAVISGTTIAAAIALAERWATDHQSFASQPGHWIVVLGSIRLVVVWPMESLRSSGNSNSEFSQWLVALAALLPFIVSILAFRKNKEWRWKSVFLVSAAEWATVFVLFGLRPLGYVPLGVVFERGYSIVPLLLTLAVVLAMSIDIAQSVRRDWLHWMGVATVLANVVVVFLWRVGV